jgi:prephenate dehydrogenase
MSFSRIAIIGPGLLGGSLALAIRERSDAHIALWARREEAVTDLRSRGLADVVSSGISEVTDGAQLIILCTPVGAMIELAGKIIAAGALASDAIFTDVGSIKGSVVQQMDVLLENSTISFVGSHPMAGSEQAGIDHAHANLFVDAACILTPSETSRGDSVERVDAFWRQLGSRMIQMPADQHDRAVARISHVPHLIASALVNSALGDDPTVAQLAAGGFRDTTRVASGSPTMWTEIAMENREALREPLERMSAEISEMLAFLDGLKHEELLQCLERAKKLRDAL